MAATKVDRAPSFARNLFSAELSKLARQVLHGSDVQQMAVCF